MLEFFRKYQSYFFAVIAFVVIISFSFFGTYNTLPADSIHEKVAFTAVDGSDIKRSTVEEMTLFISSDNEDKKLFGGVWGPNFLNDGVVRKDFLGTGLAEVLVAAYPADIERDLQTRIAKERHFSLYKHPQAGFLSVESAWSYFAPEMMSNYNTLRQSTSGTDPQAFAARVGLFLGEKQFPAPLLQRVLSYQQQQYAWLSPDPNLERMDLSLYGHHTLDDWFGSRFLHLVAETIINSSKIAEQKGYQVTKDEAWADLVRQSELSFQENLRNPHLAVANSTEYLAEQLHRLGMDRNKAAQTWRQILLFRRLFQDVGNAVVTDALTEQQFFDYAKETASGELYRLPEALQLADYRDLQKLEIYLDAISKRSQPLLLPTQLATSELLGISTIKTRFPELVQKRYLVKMAQIQKDALQTKVSIKEMWDWESNETNWAALKEQFPDLGIKPGSTRSERMAAIDSLDNRTRARLDAFARNVIIDTHPEWLQEALAAAPAKQMVVGVRFAGGNSWIKGWENPEKLMQILDNALPGEESGALSQLSGDNKNYYRIVVLETKPEEVMTFAEADREGVLDQMLDRQLEGHYVRVRGKSPEKFQQEDGSWKTFSDVKNQVADLYFQPILDAVANDYATANGKPMKVRTGDQVAPFRFYAYMRTVQGQLKQHPEQASAWIKDSITDNDPKVSLAKGVSLVDQWKLEKTEYSTERAGNETDKSGIPPQDLLALSPNEWTAVRTPVNGDLYFFQLKSKERGLDQIALTDKMSEAQELLSDDAQRNYMRTLIEEFKKKKAISLDYLNPVEESFSD